MPADPKIRAFDPLSNALDALSLRAELVARVEASGKWGIDLPRASASFHAVLAGEAWIQAGADKPVHLVGDDLLFILDGRRHQILSRPGATAVPLDSLAAKHWLPDRAVLKLSRSRAPDALLVCGNFVDAQNSFDALLGSIPPTLLLRKSEFTSFDALGAALGLLQLEATSEKPGAAIVCARLMELLLVYGLRRWLSALGARGDTWLRGLLDPSIRQALTLMHTDLGAGWTVDRLAKEVAMSRSAFAAKFAELVGEPPAKHLLRWRMLTAQNLLGRGLRVGQVAQRLGYRSDAAFSRAFTREIGSSPIQFRPRGSRSEGGANSADS